MIYNKKNTMMILKVIEKILQLKNEIKSKIDCLLFDHYMQILYSSSKDISNNKKYQNNIVSIQ